MQTRSPVVVAGCGPASPVCQGELRPTLRSNPFVWQGEIRMSIDVCFHYR